VNGEIRAGRGCEVVYYASDARWLLLQVIVKEVGVVSAADVRQIGFFFDLVTAVFGVFGGAAM
jgi:hypothetical protein